MRLLVTGGCGFIGSAFVRLLLREHRDVQITNLDALTYAGNLENLREVEGDPRHRFVHGSILDPDRVDGLLGEGVDAVVNFAAESHVDRSLHGPVAFVRTNLEGTVHLLEAVRRRGVRRFVQVSTDEVYGSLPPEGLFTEETPLHPNNPYSASKAAADLMVEAYRNTFGLETILTRSANNYGPYQHPEKFIPLLITHALEGRECPVYGDGLNRREWLYVEDNCRGLWAALERGRPGERYNFGGGNERTNVEVAQRILDQVGVPRSLLKFVQDRPGHDRRYAMDDAKARRELAWAPRIGFEEGLRDTVAWYRAHADWVGRVKSGEYRRYYEMHYGVSLRGPGPTRLD